MTPIPIDTLLVEGPVNEAGESDPAGAYITLTCIETGGPGDAPQSLTYLVPQDEAAQAAFRLAEPGLAGSETKVWKRSDISTLTVLSAYTETRLPRRIDDLLIEKTGAPAKVVWAAMEREMDCGFLEFGINLRGGWLTDTGRRELDHLLERRRE